MNRNTEPFWAVGAGAAGTAMAVPLFARKKWRTIINTRLVHNFFCWMSLFVAAAANARFLTAPRAHYALEA